MAGNTGKMTKEAIAARGPRLVLARIGRKLTICHENHPALILGKVLAHSYSRRYLEKLAAANS